MDFCNTLQVQTEVHLSPSVGGGCILTARRPGRKMPEVVRSPSGELPSGYLTQPWKITIFNR